MKIAAPRRVSHSYVQQLVASPAEVFPLLCPVREAEWLRGLGPGGGLEPLRRCRGRLCLHDAGFAARCDLVRHPARARQRLRRDGQDHSRRDRLPARDPADRRGDRLHGGDHLHTHQPGVGGRPLRGRLHGRVLPGLHARLGGADRITFCAPAGRSRAPDNLWGVWLWHDAGPGVGVAEIEAVDEDRARRWFSQT